jgi:hypothetical protein
MMLTGGIDAEDGKSYRLSRGCDGDSGSGTEATGDVPGAEACGTFSGAASPFPHAAAYRATYAPKAWTLKLALSVDAS